MGIRRLLPSACLLVCTVLLPSSRAAVPVPAGPAESLYTQLRSVDLDPGRVYSIREASLDRSALHFSLDNGTIAFTHDVSGKVTGAFFEGDGEVLLSPPDKVERASLAVFTGMAILEERFITAYFRFDDNTFADLQPYLAPSDHAPEFITEWNDTARHLADQDSLRLFVDFSRVLPSQGSSSSTATRTDHLFHARLQGRQLGPFDLFYDSASPEPIWAGQSRTVEGVTYYDTWCSFSTNTSATDNANEARHDDVAIRQFRVRAGIVPPTRLNGDARLDLEVRNGGERTVLFELSRFLQVKSVEVDGQPVEFINNPALEGSQLSRRGNDLVAVVFPYTLRAGQKMDVHFIYGGEVLSEAGKGLLYVGARGTWYPNRGLSMSNFDLEFRYPADWTLVATGKRVALNSSENQAAALPGEQASHWVSERPIPVAGFNLGKYIRGMSRAAEVVVESFATKAMERTFAAQESQPLPLPGAPLPGLAPATVPPLINSVRPDPSPARNAQPVADKSARAVEFFSRAFGPFPYGSLALTQMPGDLSQGWPGLVFLSSFAFLGPEEKAQIHVDHVDSVLGDQVLVHETAHQWWGDLINWRDYRDQWLFEALADYSAMMMLQSERPADFQLLMEKHRQDLLRQNKDGQTMKDAGPVPLGTRLSSSRFPDGYDVISYGRGTWLLHMLREMLIDADSASPHAGLRTRRAVPSEGDPFLRGLRKARQRFESKTMSTRDLLHIFEEDLPPGLCYEGHKSLDWFLNGWINGTALPRYDTRAVTYTPKATSVTVAGTLLQKDSPDDLITPVPIYAVLPGKTVLLGRVFADGPETPFHLTAPAGTHRIVIDPYQTILTGEKLK
jgi:hypothetical protein